MDQRVLSRFEQPDEVRTFPLGRFEVLHIGDLTIGRATYEPGWRWSEHVGRELGQTSCSVEHVGMVVSGRNLVTMDDGTSFEMGPGDLFAIGPGHDSEVIGDEPYVSLHFVGASTYANREPEAHRIPVEERKPAGVKGRYLHPEEHGQPRAKGIKMPAAADRAVPKAPRA